MQRPPRMCALPIPCDAAELQPLLRALEAGTPVDEPVAFPRGTLLPDGRLDLCKQQLGPENLALITRALQDNRFVQSLLLGADFIGDAGAVQVGSLLEANSGLKTVFLGCNGIGRSGLEALARGVEAHGGIDALWLKRNPIGPDGAARLAELLPRTSVRVLDLVSTDIGPDGLKHLVSSLVSEPSSLEILYLGGNGLTPGDAPLIARLIRGCASLRELFVGANLLGDDGVSEIAEALAESPLRAIGLSSNGITCDGAERVARAIRGSSVLTLDLGYSRSTDAVGATGNRIGDDGAEAIASALQTCPLQRMDLSGNQVGLRGGLALALAIERAASVRRVALCKSIPRSVRRRIDAAIASNRQGAGDGPAADHVRAVRSVYRTAGGQGLTQPRRHPPTPIVEPSRPPAPSLEPAAVQACVETLDQLRSRPDLFFERDAGLADVRAAANRLVNSIVEESRRRRQAGDRVQPEPVRGMRKAQRSRDREVAASAGIRQARSGSEVALPSPERYGRPRPCYVCKSAYADRHAFYDALCPPCAELNMRKRGQTADLRDRVAMVTGGRIKIGRCVALRLLRAGAHVVVTTRFPFDAARRYASIDDVADWSDRLQIVGIDLRDLAAVERLGASLRDRLSRLDVLVNNAAQTIHRPPAFYEHLLDGEAQGSDGLAPLASDWVDPISRSLHASVPALDQDAASPSASLAVRGIDSVDRQWFPAGARRDDGQQLDLRPVNSWRLPLGEVPTAEALESHAVGCLAPFVLVQELLPVLAGRPEHPAAVVNVSAMEGSFSRPYKAGTHPHTNMAKAGLNMLTRTCGDWLAERGVLMNSVDTGWVTDEQPVPISESIRQESGFEPPLDEEDGAARVCDPIFRVANGERIEFGRFFKDYTTTDW